MDRDVPDRTIHVDLFTPSLPSVAWNGSRAGLVFVDSDDTTRIGFVPLDAHGGVIGAERIVLERRYSFPFRPRISSAGDGDFLLSVINGHMLIVARMSPDGEVEEDYEYLFTGLIDEVSPAVSSGGHVFVAAASDESGRSGTHVYRYSYPDITWETAWRPEDSLDFYRMPFLVPAPGSSDLHLFYSDIGLHAQRFSVDFEPVGPSLDVGTSGGLMAFTAAANSSGWFAFIMKGEVGGEATVFESVDSTGRSSSHDLPSDFFWARPDSDASDDPAHGGVIATRHDERIHVHAHLTAHPAPGEEISEWLEVNDPTEAVHSVDLATATIAWTQDGFLIVWDTWLEDRAMPLSSSFIAVEPTH